MISPNSIQKAFQFLLTYGYELLPDRSHGRVIRAEYAGQAWDIEVMYEPGDQHFDVIAYAKVAGQRSDYDDREQTMHLGDMRKKALEVDRTRFLSVKADASADQVQIDSMLGKAAAETAASIEVLSMR